MKKGIVVSDLHLLSWRSNGQSCFDKLSGRFSELDALVLNGDIFDFRWANRPHTESVPFALDWLAQLRTDFPHLAIHFIPGNHDCIPEFVDGVAVIDGISFHPFHLVLGKNLFLHGDAATWQMDFEGFRSYRSGWEQDSPRGRTGARLYDAADMFKLSDLTHHLWFGRGAAIRRIIWHLDRVRPGWKEEVEECFFGHTHLPLKGVELEGVRFHNTGSGIRGAPFVPIQFNYQSNLSPERNEY